MRGDEMIVVMGMVMAGIAGMQALRGKACRKVKMARTEAIREALRHPTIDDSLRNELIRALAREEQPTALQALGRRLFRVETLVLLWVAASWLMFVGGGLILGLSMSRLVVLVNRDAVLSMVVLGFAMLTLPMAWQELRARLSAAPTSR